MCTEDVVVNKTEAWELFVTHLQPLLEEMPYLQPFHDRLQLLVGQARELDEQQEKARAEAREVTRRRQEVQREGDNLRARAAAHLRASFGFTSEHLIPFGIHPHPRHAARRGEPDAESAEPGP